MVDPAGAAATMLATLSDGFTMIAPAAVVVVVGAAVVVVGAAVVVVGAAVVVVVGGNVVVVVGASVVVVVANASPRTAYNSSAAPLDRVMVTLSDCAATDPVTSRPATTSAAKRRRDNLDPQRFGYGAGTKRTVDISSTTSSVAVASPVSFKTTVPDRVSAAVE